jgi:tryptophanyl-tRNA synthetase
MSKKILVSGIKPTGRLHFGNYFGAMKQNIEIGNSDAYESFVFIADYHALTSMKGGRTEKLRESTFDLACAYIALGLDLSKVSLFRQSSVPEVTELAWIFNNIVTMPYLMRAHAFKDHVAKSFEEVNEKNIRSGGVSDNSLLITNLQEKGVEIPFVMRESVSSLIGKKIGGEIVGDKINVGLFDYPVLMAADILMYHADIVPVGADQKQHIEYARDIAGFFNREWGNEYFKLPSELIRESVATVPGIDGRKMSKSYDNVIPLFGTDDEIKKAVMGIVTDSARPEDKKNPDTNNIYNIHKLFLEGDELASLRARYENGGLGYKEAKELLLASIISFITPKREKYDYYQNNPSEVEKILREGGMKAKARAEETMKKIRQITGLN